MRDLGGDVNMPEPRVNVTADEIAGVVAVFYQRIRQHPVLGSIFFKILSRDADLWREHEAKIAEFWCKTLLYSGNYSGNPMLVHSGIDALKPQHFAIWLGLFDQTLTHLLKNKQAQEWSRLAHRIGRGLRLGIEASRQRDDAVPDLRR